MHAFYHLHLTVILQKPAENQSTCAPLTVHAPARTTDESPARPRPSDLTRQRIIEYASRIHAQHRRLAIVHSPTIRRLLQQEHPASHFTSALLYPSRNTPFSPTQLCSATPNSHTPLHPHTFTSTPPCLLTRIPKFHSLRPICITASLIYPHSLDLLFRLLTRLPMFCIHRNPITPLRHLIKHTQLPLHQEGRLPEPLSLNPSKPVGSLAQNLSKSPHQPMANIVTCRCLLKSRLRRPRDFMRSLCRIAKAAYLLLLLAVRY